jgi:thiol-disulfide isomerase/thioredoxin
VTRCLLIALLLLPVLAQAAPKDAENPGRLLNLAQQHLARGEIDEAIDALERSIDGNPAEGYAWGLLAEALVWGRGHGPEVEASWEALASSRPGDPHSQLRVVRARMATHRRDKFTNADTDWVVASTELIESVLEEASTAEVRYAALIGRRDLRYRAGMGTEALIDGVAAHKASPRGLQGRISAVQRANADHDVARFESVCLDILRTDPWAAEVCSLLWTGKWEDDVEAARERVLARIDDLHDRAVGDPVLANEILKFYDRRKQPAGGAKLLLALRKDIPDFKVADNSRWYRGSFIVPPAYRTLFADTNRANNTDDAAERLGKLLAIAPVEVDPHAMVQRWRWRVVEAAGAMEPPDLQTAGRQLRSLVHHDPADARAWMELSRLMDRDEALHALLRAEDAVLSGGWDPWEKYGGLPFAEAMKRRRHFVADLQLQRAVLYADAGDTDGAWSLALQAAWASDHTLPGTWELVARLADARGEEAFAREADVEHVASLLAQGDAAPEAAADAVQRFISARPELDDADPDAAWQALLAAASVRRDEGGGSSSPTVGRKEQHPYVGKSAPELAVTSLAGAPRTLAELRGQVVVVDFWATWCGPCKKAMPELQSAADTMSDAPVTFLLVSVDTELEKAREYWAGAELSMDAAWSPNGKAAQADWRVKGIPSTFVVDQDGVVRHHHQGYRSGEGRKIEAEIRALLARP